MTTVPQAGRSRLLDRLAFAVLILFAIVWFVPLAWAVATAL